MAEATLIHPETRSQGLLEKTEISVWDKLVANLASI